MPDGAFCRRMAFDNATAEITRADVDDAMVMLQAALDEALASAKA